MRIHAQEIIKRNVQFLMFIVIVIFASIAIILNLRTLSHMNRPLIIGIDANGTRIVSENSDPIYQTEAVSFIQGFLMGVYNFDSQNFMKRVGSATALMSEELWKKKRSEIMDLKTRVERDEITLTGQILKMTVDESGIYHGLILLKEKSRLSEREHRLQVSLKIVTVPRTQSNPYGLEIDSYEESLVHD